MTAALTAEELAAMEARAERRAAVDAAIAAQGGIVDDRAVALRTRALKATAADVPTLLAEVRRLTAALDGARREGRREPPTRDEVRRHHVEHGGYWLVSSVRVGHPTREDCRPMVLQVIDGEYGPHAGTPHAGYGGAWDDPWALMTGAEWQRIDRDGRLMADEGSDGQ